MKKIKKLLIWYYMFNKRLFHKGSFLIILLLIPISLTLLNTAFKGDSGIMTIALSAENENDTVSKEVLDYLLTKDSVLKFDLYSSPEKAEDAVRQNKADAAWLLDENFNRKLSLFASGERKKPFLTVVVRENSVPISLSNEVLFSSVFPKLSYESYKHFIYENVPLKDSSEETLKNYYDKYMTDESLVKIVLLDSDKEVSDSKNFLLAPIRGILSLIVMLSGFAAAMYFLSDLQNGKYDWLSYKKRLYPAFASCLSAVSVSSAAVFLALVFSGMAENILRELLCLFMFSLSAAGFCLNLCTIFRSSGKLGALIPFLTITMLVLCPIFFSVNFLSWLKPIFPPYHYLNSLHNARFMWYMGLYFIISLALSFVINELLNKKERNISKF